MPTEVRPFAPLPEADEKGAALDAVLKTPSFVRSGQLRSFLRYICEMEIAGRATELGEYRIGVEALGRPPGYSTADDSTVRRHAHALRQKLQDVYASGEVDTALRIELPKGSYVPRFVPAPKAGSAPGEAEAPAETAEPAPEGLDPRRLLLPAAAFLAGVMITLSFAMWWGRGKAASDPIIREAWAPFGEPGANPLICLSAPPHIGILPYPEDAPLPDQVEAVTKPDLAEWYRQHYPLSPDQHLATHLTTGPIRLGEVQALVAAVKTLDAMGAPFQLLAEKNVEVPALRGRNLLLLANPEYSFAAAKLLERATWTVGYDVQSRRRVIRPVRPDGAEKRSFLSVAGTAVVYGLVTVRPSEGTAEGAACKTVIISCTHSAGCQAAMEYFASASDLRALRARFVSEGRRGFPDAYQVVVKCGVYKVQAISREYAAHTVLAP